MIKWIIFTLRVPGFHRWKNAPVKHKYLSNWHRHEFHIKCEIKVNENRNLEIINEKENLLQFLLDRYRLSIVHEDLRNQTPLDFHNHIYLNDGDDGSCEDFAYMIADWLSMCNETDVNVTVLEDGENGARAEVRYEP